MEALAEKVKLALGSVKHIPPESISMDTSLENLQLDSLDKITLLFELEQQLNLSIPDEQLQAVRTVSDVVEAISRLTPEAAAGTTAVKDAP